MWSAEKRAEGLDEDASTAVDGGHGSDHLHGLDLRSSQAARGSREGSASADATSDWVAKKKNDRIDAAKIADCLRCDFLPECHMTPTAIRDRRQVLRYRNLVQRQAVQMKNRVSGLLMETGVSHNKQRLHKVGYFGELMSTNRDICDAVRPLLNLSRGMIRRSGKLEYEDRKSTRLNSSHSGESRMPSSA